jgi:hypothetical protein
MTKRVLIVASLTTILVAFSTVAGADRGSRGDGDATSGPLDIKLTWHGHKSGGRVVHGITTYSRWRSSLLQNKNWIAFSLDSASGYPDGNRWLWITYSRRSRLRAGLYQPGMHPTDRFIERVKVWRPNGRTVKVALRASLLFDDRPMDHYDWNAWSSFEDPGSRGCPESDPTDFPYGSCQDSAPNGFGDRSIRHRLP